MADDLVGGIVCNGCWETCAHAPGIGYYCRNEGCTYEHNRAKAMLWHIRPVEPRDARIEALEAALAEARQEREATEGRFMAQIAALQIALAEALRERTEARAEAANLRADLKQAEGRVKAITIAMHDAIRRPMGVVPETAEPFYQPALASDALLDRQGE